MIEETINNDYILIGEYVGMAHWVEENSWRCHAAETAGNSSFEVSGEVIQREFPYFRMSWKTALDGNSSYH